MISMRRILCLWLFAAGLPNPTQAAEADYAVLTVKDRQPPPFSGARLIIGPRELAGGQTCQWFQVEAWADTPTNRINLFATRFLRGGEPFQIGTQTNTVERYQLRVPETGECLEYRERHSGKALLPSWTDFERQFIPAPVRGSRFRDGLPETCEWLGHILSWRQSTPKSAWTDWGDARLLVLDPGLLVGNSRPFKDREGKRLPQQPQRQDYTYVPFDGLDYRRMMEAGFNLFTIRPEQEQWVRAEPVFYLRDANGNPPLRYPADLYRANYLGPVMFIDEPSIIMVGDTNIHRTLRYFSDAAALIRKRTAVAYQSESSYGARRLARSLTGRGINLGDLRLLHEDYPSWETLYETTYYQMEGGGAGLVHEGRYQPAPFDEAVERFTGARRQHAPAEMLAYHYAYLRGGTRPFHKAWGTAIYGQCDTNLAPLALTLAYDMGARYLWFWSSDHDHHLPWLEQLDLARQLRAHEKSHPRPHPSAQSAVDVAIVMPYGYFISLDNLWWVRVMDKAGLNEDSQQYRRLVRRVLDAARECHVQGWSYDITADAGGSFPGYRRVMRVTDE